MKGRVLLSWRRTRRVFGMLVSVVLLCALVAGGALLAYGEDEDPIPPTPPTTVDAVSGTDPVIAVISWAGAADNVGVLRYRIHRAVSATGTYSVVGTVMEPGSKFEDTSGVPGQSYYYRVSALDAAGNESALSPLAGPVAAAWTRVPHAAYDSASSYCDMCHVPHVAASAGSLLREAGESPAETAVCYACHDGSGASTNIKTGDANSFARASGHAVESVQVDPDLTNTCAGCHSPHRDYAITPMLPRTVVNDTPLGAEPNAWCLACHNADSDWYGPGYPDPASPSVDETGYPTVGTFPVTSATSYIAYTDAAGNPHSGIEAMASATPPRVQGDCLYCHASHTGPSAYDGLVAEFRPSSNATLADDQTNGTYAAVCFACHGDNDFGLTAPPTDIRQFVTGTGERAGHRIKTAGGVYPVGSPLPCYECHNPHGTTRGNDHLFSDVLGEGLSTGTAPGDEHRVREFCFTCHTTAGDVAGGDALPYGWDSALTAYSVAAAGSKVAGLARDAIEGDNVVRLPDVSGHYRDDTQSCYACHGSSYEPGGNNVHDPSGGVSDGGVACYACHSEYQAYMEDGVGAKVGSERSTVYHHTMGGDFPFGGTYGAYVDGDYAPGPAGDYPQLDIFNRNLYCVTCHVDHDKFNSDPGANLRVGALADPTNKDFDAAAVSGGICTYCHGLPMPKSGPDQASDGMLLAQSVSPGEYDGAAHDYEVSSEFGSASSFQANCSKCHNDEQARQFATSEFGFGVHYSASARLISAFGGTLAADLSPEHCYGCHSRASDGIKDTDGVDYYRTSGMSELSQKVFDAMENDGASGSNHPASLSDGDAMKCESCHNPHRVSLASPVSDPDDTYDAAAYGSAVERSAFCLKCHDGSGAPLPAIEDMPYTYVPVGVTMASGSSDKSAYASTGHWSASGSISAAEQVACGACHDNHASTAPKLLGTYDSATDSNMIGTTTITANNNAVCYACHAGASTSFAAPVRDAVSGYPGDGTWPGMSVYTQAFVAGMSGNGHVLAQGAASQNVLPTIYAAGDCKVCHDVHGTANPYDETRLGFSPTDFALCFDCHDVDGPATSNIKTYYPASVGGSGAGSGHQIKTAAGTLPLGSGLPCYDCHNPHGSAQSAYGLTVVTETAPGVTLVLGDAPGEIRMSSADQATAAHVRNFCFGCHTTSDTGKGWDGDSLDAVTAGAEVEGIDRTVYDETGGLVLRLPDNVAQHREGATQSCYVCHGNDYGLAGSNVHNPSGGVSSGGQDCYVCHSAYQQHMEDDAGAATGTSNGLSYHHVLGGALGDGDTAFPAGAYPTSTTDVYCLSCHVDHDLFNTPDNDLAANLRPDLGAAPVAGAAYDWSDAANAGVCTACHGSNALPKSGAAEKLGDGRTHTPTVGNVDYDASAHKYAVGATFTSDGTPVFAASCSKCHNDEQPKEYQDSAYAFGTHWSVNQHILSALGGADGGALQESHCYRCHAETGDFAANGGSLPGTPKPAAGRDWYDAAPMSTSGTEKVYQQFALASTHPVQAAGGDSVECESCHNAHEVSASARVSDPENTYSPYTYSGVANQPAFCLKCHDGALPSQTITAATYVPYTVTQANTAVNNKSDAAKTSKGHWTTAGSISAGERVSCAVCHDNHGSNAPKLLGAYDPTDGTNKIGSAVISANNNAVCYACHTSATAAAYTREPNGYPGYGTWPGAATYNSGIHNAAAVKWPGRADATGGECWNCHDVHGTMSAYDELLGQFSPSSAGNDQYALCFTCHDSDGPSSRDIKQYYPASSGGTSSATNAGHKIKTAGGTLPVGTGLPCYDCHNPHGSAEPDGLLVETMIGGVRYRMGDSATEIGDIAVPASNRRFCFLCHTTATGRGTNSAGTGYTNIAATDTVEGISRNPAVDNNALKLSGIAAHTEADTRSCLSCHGGMTAGNPVNVHAPSSGAGGGPCLGSGCHGSDSTERLDRMVGDVTTYHHVLDGASPDRNTYPTPSQSTLYCLSCHVDHANFNTPAGNLRSAYNDTPAGASGVNSDFPGNGTYGVCISCHSVAQPKTGQGTTQKAGGSSTTPAISGAVYDASAHDYKIADAAKVGYGPDAFQANCIKCHDDGATGPSARQTGTFQLAPHFSAENRIAQALGAALAGTSTATEENLCYTCHRGAGPNDGYGAIAMDAASRAVNAQFTGLAYTHDVDARSGIHRADETQAQISAAKHVECEDCHDPHAAGSVNNVPGGADGNQILAGSPIGGISGQTPVYPAAQTDSATLSTRWVAPTSFSAIGTADREYQICFKCHSSANTGLASWGGSGADAWTDVALEFNTDNASYHPVLGPVKLTRPTPAANPGRTATWMLAPWTAVGAQTMTCTDCHASSTASTTAQGPHGSAIKHLLRGYWPTRSADGTGVLGSADMYTLGESYAGLLCANCHNMANISIRAHTSHTNGSRDDCVYCHVTVPHGAGLYGLIGDGDGTMPSRYAYQNNLANMRMRGYSGNPDNGGSCDESGCGQHSNPGAWDW